MIVAGIGCPASTRAASSSAAVPDVSSSAPGPDGDRVVVAADHVDELGVDRALQRGDDVGGLAAERAARREPLVLRLVAERLVGVEQVLGRQLVAGPRDVLRVEVEERLLVRSMRGQPRSRRRHVARRRRSARTAAGPCARSARSAFRSAATRARRSSARDRRREIHQVDAALGRHRVAVALGDDQDLAAVAARRPTCIRARSCARCCCGRARVRRHRRRGRTRYDRRWRGSPIMREQPSCRRGTAAGRRAGSRASRASRPCRRGR